MMSSSPGFMVSLLRSSARATFLLAKAPAAADVRRGETFIPPCSGAIIGEETSGDSPRLSLRLTEVLIDRYEVGWVEEGSWTFTEILFSISLLRKFLIGPSVGTSSSEHCKEDRVCIFRCNRNPQISQQCTYPNLHVESDVTAAEKSVCV